jgi:tetratricopeptide (TPR) repeat protein
MKPGRAAALRDLGYKAFRLGHAARARQHFSRALSLFRESCGEEHAVTATAFSDLGVAESALGDHAASRAHHERALRIRRNLLGPDHEDVATSLHNLGIVCRALGDLADAEAHHQAALRIWRVRFGPAHPAVARGLIALGHVAAQHEAHQDAASYWKKAADVLRGQPGPAAAQLASVLNNLGIAQRSLHNLDGAEASFEAALAEKPDMPEARHNLAALLARQGRAAEAKQHRDIALRQQSVFVETSLGARASVLILCGSDAGNVRLDHVLPETQFSRIWVFVEHVTQTQLQALPPHDAVFNAAGDPDLAAPIAAKLSALLALSTRRFLNPPARIAATRRDLLHHTLGARDGVVVPRTLRIARAGDIAAAGMAPPFLLRPAGSHGGAGTIRINDEHGLAGLDLGAAPAWYVSQFVDCRAADGLVRKYRIIFVDRQPYPYHLAISRHWMVHYFSADMPGHAWKLREEQAFLDDWRAVLGEGRAAAIDALGRAIDLDYCGVDFAIDAAGRLVIFEANATMLVHAESSDGPLAFKNKAVVDIVGAFGRLLLGLEDG